jgi:Ca2+-binding RTX toxin-like protein
VIIDRDATPGNLDTILLNSDVTTTDITLIRSNDDLILSIIGTEDTLTVKNWFKGESTEWQVEQIQFADGVIWDSTYITSVLTTSIGTVDYLIGTLEIDVIDGGYGNDTINGMEGNVVLYGGAGEDMLDGGAGNNNLYGEEGSDLLNGAASDDVLFDGGPGNDYIINGSSGKSTYVMNRGGGFDTIEDGMEGTGTVVFGEGIDLDDLSVQMRLDDWGDSGEVQLAIGIGHDEGLLIESFWNSGGYGGTGLTAENLSIMRFVFADGSELTLDEILARVDGGVIGEQYGADGDDTLLGSVAVDTIYGNDGNDRIEARDNADVVYGNGGNDIIDAGSGKDTVFGGEGDDIIAGGLGNDTLAGGAGSNVYVFNRGDGRMSLTMFTIRCPIM